MGFETYEIRDALLQRELVVADGAATDPIDIGLLTERGARLNIYDFKLWAGEHTVAALPASSGLKFQLEFSDDAKFTDPDIYTCNRWAQTGSASGAEAAMWRFRIPSRCPRYVRVKAAKTGTPGTLTAKFGLEVLG